MPDAKATMMNLLAAFEARDADRVMSLLSPDARIEAGITRVPPTDFDTLRHQISETLSCYDWIHYEPRMLIGENGSVAALLSVRARFDKDLVLFGARLPTAGQSVDYDVAFFAEVDEAGRITHFIRLL